MLVITDAPAQIKSFYFGINSNTGLISNFVGPRRKLNPSGDNREKKIFFKK